MPKIVRLTPKDVKTLLEEKAPPAGPQDPLTVTNSIVLHLTERVQILESAIVRQGEIIKRLIDSLHDEGGEASEPAAVPPGATVKSDDEGEAVVVNNTRVVSGAVMPSGPGGAVQGSAPAGGPVRAADPTPFPAGVPSSATPGTGPRVTVVSSAAEAPAASGAGKKK
jgi:hypothetical protein